MPDFVYDGKRYYNPVEFALDFIGGTWKMPILWRLKDKEMRYSEIRRSIGHISDKMLTSQLKEMEKNGFINREVFAEVPPKTVYSITPKGRQVIPVIEFIREYGLKLMDEMGIENG